MDTLEIYKKLNREIKLNYKNRADFGRKVDLGRQEVYQLMGILMRNNGRNMANRLLSVLEKAGYRVTIEKVNRG